MDKKPYIIAFVGMPGSGKGTCVDYVVEKYHVPRIYFGGFVYDEVARRGLDIVRDEKMVREEMRAKEGMAVMAKHAIKKINEYLAQGQNHIVLDGVYSWAEDRLLSDRFGEDYLTIAVAAPRALRWQRVIQRKDARRTYTLEEIRTREIAEIENSDKGGPIAHADYTVLNDSTLPALHKQIDDILQKLGF